jgi:hypothetical protein
MFVGGRPAFWFAREKSWAGIEREMTELFFRREGGKQTGRNVKLITISYYDVKLEMARRSRSS